MKRYIVLLLTSVLVLSVAQVAFSRPFSFSPQSYSFKDLDIVKVLKLTDEQIDKIKALREEYYKKMQDIRIKIQDGMFSLQQLRLQKQVDQSLINDKKKEINDLAKQLSDLYKEYWGKLKTILTSEQLSKLSRSFGPDYWGRRFNYRFWCPRW